MMKTYFQLIPLALATLAPSVHADEFRHDGIRILFPGKSVEEKLVRNKPGSSSYRVRQLDAGNPSTTLVETFVHVTARAQDQAFEAERAAFECLTHVLLNINRENLKNLEEPKSVALSGKTAMRFAMSHLGKYASDTWRDDLVNVAVCCVVTPARQIEIQVITPLSTSKELLNNALAGIEKLELLGD